MISQSMRVDDDFFLNDMKGKKRLVWMRMLIGFGASMSEYSKWSTWWWQMFMCQLSINCELMSVSYALEHLYSLSMHEHLL